ncbi:hypothetical protein WH52_05465 [Tenacibaculum holothuriorum]|uniref:Uncharacterized protein n=1 Tax=Tenacibaculum holothuriorum TaxID=1635173 RepID=A0A1Y2PDI4_9FLAO|nr:DUF5916 domain-containing protein [Tenacibaculum holothuriorum]OSY88230.1 hypothetical protein WH52_05465 [Tenacibaculum holothuriorum]
MRKLFVLYCYVTTCFCFGQNNPTIPFFKEEIKVDGNLNEAVWNQAQEFSGFYNFYPNDEGKSKNKTVVKMFHDGEKLYISAIYFDTTSKNNISTLKRDNHGGSVVHSDAFGVVLDPFNKENNGYYFTINAGNAQLEALIDFDGTDYSQNESWNATWESKTKVEGTKKIYEMAIPFKALNYDIANNTWGIQFFYRDFKIPLWMTYTDLARNYIQYDLRFTKDVVIENLPQKSASRFTATPSITYNYQKNVTDDTHQSVFTPSLDIQYNLTSSLRLDASINPDFSQIDVDQQVTNITRFAVNFPERRNFFLENSDLFNTLGTFGVNPFYSRRIGATTNMQFGIKLSGNVSSNTRIGVLNAQTEEEESNPAQNYAVLVGRQKLSDAFTTTAYLVNRQETDGFSFKNDYNRVLGLNFNYKSKNNKWSGQTNFGKSYSDGLKSDNNFFNIEGQYNTRETYFKGAFKSVDKNFIADVGFTPRLYNFDAINQQTIRESYLDSYINFQKRHYPKNSKTIDNYRYLYLENDMFFSSDGTLTESNTSIGNTIWFKKNLAAVYLYVANRYNNLKYGFDILGNGNPIQPGIYNDFYTFFGYNNSASNTNFYYSLRGTYGEYFGGKRYAAEVWTGYRMLPFANIAIEYKQNYIDLNNLGKETFHLLNFTGEVFFSNRLNWTTYVQYNTQRDNFNINSRLQWEYKPLSYVYLVVTDNFNKRISRQNWGVAFKMNYRFDF